MPQALSAQREALTFRTKSPRLILDNPFDDEPAQARLNQFALLNIHHHMQISAKKLTLKDILELKGLTRGSIYQTVDLLAKRNLISETFVKNSLGQGRAIHNGSASRSTPK